ncbi:MAG TPA: 50S ribosomal protein L37e [Candidatus Thermoplasmatota archaeon]|nr:50S ribosomal protein L37e [Candidatus Thermoplasmatota archaeon]
MTKGTTSKGKFKTHTHRRCRRCGRHSFHVQQRRCASCGFGDGPKLRKYAWSKKTHRPNRGR